MSDELADFHHDFFQDVLAAADAGGQYAEDVFFERFCEQVVEAGHLDTADRVHYVSPKGLRVDGYGGDPATSNGVLSLVVSDFAQSPDVGTINKSDVDKLFKRLRAFLEAARDERFRDSLEESSPAFGLADLIASRWGAIDKVRLFIISNRVLKMRMDEVPSQEIGGVAVTHSIWDLSRLHRFASSGAGREDIEIDLESDFGGSLPILPAHMEHAGYEAYLVVVPGAELAAIYDRWSSRLLEQNVRVFLQARGNVNKGIRNTLEQSPEMFFAYNNGVTATAESIELSEDAAGPRLMGLKNLQIVNGGQTTASIHAASKKGVDLSKVFVQMKLSIVEHERAVDVVPKISEFANSQNRVNAADFFSNHPYHVRMQEFSRRVFAPSPDGTLLETKWFYERARGQYADARSRLTAAEKKKFELEFPKRQVFSKTDLAKFLMVWEKRPDLVSRGAQKNFAAFAKLVGDRWEKGADDINEAYYRDTISKAIIFRSVEALVSAQPWYEGGYRANVVAYAIAKLAHDADTMGRAVDFRAVWKRQALTEGLEEALVIASAAAHEVITSPPPGTRNVTEWAKQQAAWNRLENHRVAWPDQWLTELMGKAEQAQRKKSAKQVQKIDNGIEVQALVINAGPEVWKEIKRWGQGRGLITAREAGILDVCSSIPKKIPTEAQCAAAMEVMKRLHLDGCRFGLQLVQMK